MKLTVLAPHGFCAGVTNALRKARALLDAEQTAGSAPRADPATPPIYCLHELVHNELVVGELKAKGMSFVESLDDIPEGATVLFSAHGVSPAVREAAAAKRLRVVDATCPFVTRVHTAARAFAEKGLPVVIIGHPGHAEVRGIQGEVPEATIIPDRAAAEAYGTHGESTLSTQTPKQPAPPHPPTHNPHPPTHNPNTLPLPLSLVSQTTMNADEVAEIVAVLRRRFAVETMAEVCHATKERQDAVKAFDGDALLVLGSANSSNTRRLCEVARCRTFRAGTLDEVRALDLSGVNHLGVTSGASTPESFFNAVIRELEAK